MALRQICAAAAALALCGALNAGEPAAGGNGGTSYARVRVTVPYPGAESPGRPPSVSYQEPLLSTPIDEEPASLVTIDEFPVAGQPDAEGRVLATLYGTPITEEDVKRELWERRWRETFDWMIGRELLKRELRRNDLVVSEREVDERLGHHLEGLRRAFPNLRRQDDLTRAASGMPLGEYRERTVWTELALRKIMKVAMKPDEDKLRACYADMQAEFIRPERVRLSQVFIAPQPPAEAGGIASPEDWALAERQIQDAHRRLRMGEEFSEVSRAFGTGGQLSRWVERGDLLRELEEPAFSISPGSVTTPIKSGMGYHILTVEERQERQVPKFEEVRDEVLARFEEEQFVRLAGEFMARLKSNAIKNGGLIMADGEDSMAEAAQ